VLLVEDNMPFLEMESRFLGLQPDLTIVGRVTSAEIAISKVDDLHPDLVLMDLTLPGMNGLQATLHIKKQPNPPRIIILTLHDQHAYRDMSKMVGADGFITKDKFGEPLIQMIHGLFDPAEAPPIQ